MSTLRIPYRPKPVVMALAGLFFAGCGAMLFHAATTNDRGLILNGVIEFGTGGATTFYWVLFACCVGFVLFAGLGLVRAFGAPREVVLDDRTLTAPRGGLSGTTVTVPLATITALQLREVNRQRFLTVHYREGKLSIPASMLPSKDDLAILAVEIEQRRSAPAPAPAPPAPSGGAPLMRQGFGRRGL